MLTDCALVAFVSTTDLDRARAFYVGELGLVERETSPYALVLDAHGTTLRVTLTDAVVPAPYTVLGWLVPDIDAVLDDLEPVLFDGMEQDDRGVWTTPAGSQVAWFRDPEGHLLSVTQE